MPAYLEVNTMIYNDANNIYKYNIDYIKEYIKILYAEGGVLFVSLDKLGLLYKYQN